MHKEKGMYTEKRDRIFGIIPSTLSKFPKLLMQDDTAACWLRLEAHYIVKPCML